MDKKQVKKVKNDHHIQVDITNIIWENEKNTN